jgi:hypothetical protein
MPVRIGAIAFIATVTLISPAWAQWEGSTERPASPVYPYGLDPTGQSYLPHMRPSDPVYPWGPDPTGQSYSPYIGPPDPRIWRYPMNVISETDTQIRNLTREFRAGRMGEEEYLRRKRALMME